MRNPNRWRLIQTMAATAAMAAFAGCQTSSHDERSDGRVVDDKGITEKIQKELKREMVYKFDTVETSTFGGVVQLSGFVNSEAQKRRAEEIAQQVPGVRQVVNGIALKPEPLLSPTGSTNAAQSRIYSE